MVTLDLADPTARFVDFVAEDKGAPLEDVVPINGGNFVAVYKRDVRTIPDYVTKFSQKLSGQR